MNFNQAPTSGNESQGPTLAELNTQLEEAQAMMDGAKMGEIEAKIAGLEAQEKAKQEEDASKPPSVAEILKEGDPVKLAELDDRFAVAQPLLVDSVQKTPIEESAKVERPLDDAHVMAFELKKNIEAIEDLVSQISEASSYDKLGEMQKDVLYKLNKVSGQVLHDVLHKKLVDAVFRQAKFFVESASYRKDDEYALVNLTGIIKDLKSKESVNADSGMTGFKMGSIATILSEEQSSRLSTFANNKFKDITGVSYSVQAVRDYARSFN